MASSHNTNVPEVGETTSRRQPRNRGSDMLTKHFTLVVDDVTGEKTDVCNYCGKVYKHSGGYGSMTNHMRSNHKAEFGIDSTQTQLTRFSASGPGSSSSQLFKYNDSEWKDNLTKFIAMEHLAFTFGEKATFNNLVTENLNPAASKLTRMTCKRKMMELYGKGQIHLRELFKKLVGRVSICSDIWSDHWQTHSYMGVTCHWIDENWFIQKRILAFRLFDDAHTAHNIYLMISNILQDYGLVQKILTVGFDNASANSASINELKAICQPNLGGRFFHVRCACHILNLCVQDGLKSLNEHIAPIRKAINLIWSYSKVRREWSDFCKQNGVRPKKFGRDVPTRWNSTYFLLNQSFEYKELLCSFIAHNQYDVLLYPSNWEVCSKILDILKVFNDATNILSGVYYPTSNIFLLTALDIAGVLTVTDPSETDNPDALFDENYDVSILAISQSVFSMREKWLSYYKEIPLLYLVAFVLDPRFKIDDLENALQNYYNLLGEQSIIVSSIVDTVKRTLFELYNDYVSRYNIQVTDSSTESVHEPAEQSKLPAGRNWLMQRSKRTKSATATTNAEINSYLMTNFEFPQSAFAGQQFLILDWWKKYQTVYPVLSVIAKEVLAAPVSTVSVEQAFSSGGNILDDRRSRLKPETLEAQTCLDDWCRADRRQQEHEPENFEDLCDNTDTSNTDGSRTGPPSPDDDE